MRRYVESCLARSHVKSRIVQQCDGAKRRYAFWLLKRHEHIGAVLRGEAPVPEHFSIPQPERKEEVRFLHRLLRKSLGSPPMVRLRRSMVLDSTLYRVFEHPGRFYIVMSLLTKGKRLNLLPLREKGPIYGNIRVVWDQARDTAVINNRKPWMSRPV